MTAGYNSMFGNLKVRLFLPGLLLAGISLNSAAAGGAPDISKTPAYELLGALGLLNVAPKEGLSVGEKTPRPDSSYVVRLTLDSKPAPAPFAARGLGILQNDLVNSSTVSLRGFDLLYNSKDRLIAVFPVIPDEVFKREPQSREKWEEIRPAYYDLSQYYMEVPRPGSPGEVEKWIAFADSCGKDQVLISGFAQERFKPVIAAYPSFLRTRLTYRLHEIDAVTGEWVTYEFSPLAFKQASSTGPVLSDVEPEELMRLFREVKPNKRRTVIPTFPTVYALANITPDETEYMRQVSTKFSLAPDSDILVVGPGTGIDAWAASFRTSRPVSVAGINPLEVANTVAAAKISGFKVRAIIADNVADEEGKSRFPGETFDAVFWNMPAVWEEGFPAGHIPSLYDLWDGDIGGSVLKRFAKALPGLLKPDGRAFLWNFAPYVDGKNLVAEALGSAGAKEKVFNVEVERFLKRKLPKEEWFKGCLYTVSRPR